MLSAALDGECSAQELDQLLAELESNPELKEQWSRLCLARDAVTGAQVSLKQRSICADVMKAIGDEAPSQKVAAFVPRRAASRTSFWRPAIGLATAAGVASVAFMLGYQRPAVPPVGAVTAQVAPHAVVASAPAPKTTAVIADNSATARTAPNAGASGWESVEQEEDARQLNTYLIDYSSYRSGAGMADTLGYARFAAHTAEYNPGH
ncbi:MAG TPA: sigma-E factor negative regulatory protein [Nevskiaceae bacterium]|nr:sigma-E factor negative regulatory protein [Nevskiaceae bacterium]